MTNHLSILAIASWLSLAACTADAGSSAEAISPLVDCSARYQCVVNAESGASSYALTRSTTGQCTLAGLQLFEDGRALAPYNSKVGSWSSTPTSLEVCFDFYCYRCQRDDLASTSPSGAHCTGSPSSCSSGSPGSCSSIRGCYMRTRVRYNGTYDNYCDGSPDDCEDMSSESSCRSQGCEWK